jgi:choline-sulfatase/uncharacterized sulfatase
MLPDGCFHRDEIIKPFEMSNETASPRRPNILFLVSDQHQARLLGCAGHSTVQTPHLDALAAEGIQCHRAYTANPICTPSRVSMLSGQYPHNHGYFGLGGPAPVSLPNLFGHLRKHGYRTAGIGKLHLPDEPRNWVGDDLDLYADCYRSVEGDRFQSPYHAYLREEGVYETEDSRKIPDANGGFNSFDARPTTMAKEHVVEYWCSREANRFIDASGDQPWCMQVSFPRPHHQLTPLPEFWDMYDGVSLPEYYKQPTHGRPSHFRATVERLSDFTWNLGENGRSDPESGLARAYRGTLACISMVDDAIGQVLKHLEERGQKENTIIVYTTDHGAYHGVFGLPEKYPGICSEEVCRIPMIWSFPEKLGHGRTCRALVESVDILPTLLALAGVEPMETTDGRDATAVLRGDNKACEREYAVTENAWSKAIRWKDFRMVFYPRDMFDGEEVGELYNLAEDPWETRNLYHDPSFRDIRESMTRKVLEWLVCSTRHVTSHPPLRRDAGGREVFRTAGDGKESNLANTHRRLSEGRINYL